MRRFFYKNGKLYIDKELTTLVEQDNCTYEILKHVKIPLYLTNVIVYEQTYEEALSRLIFVGSDSKGRRQYFYGKKHIQQRNNNRNNIFVRVHRVMKKINNFINKNINKNNDTIQFQFAIFMLMETSFFIRMGKMKYFKENNTVGLLTLQNKNINIEKGKIYITFIGKDKIIHEFIIRKNNRLYKPLLKIIDISHPESFLFNRLNERRVYNLMKMFHIHVKDLRTYGVNYTFLYNFWTNVKSLLPLPSVKKLISLSIKQTAEIVGHTPSISKNAYMASIVLELIYDKDILETIHKTTFDEFISLMVEYVETKTICIEKNK
nr:DNA topoisomerase type I [Wadden Sea poxvirus]